MLRTLKVLLLAIALAVSASAALAGPASAIVLPGACGTAPAGPTVDSTYNGVRIHGAYPCQWLDRGQTWSFGNARLTLKTDGNLVILDRSGYVRWSAGTVGKGATQMLFQRDGNLVLYTAGYAKAVWSSRTNGACNTGNPYLGLQSDSNFVIYCAVYRVLWSTHTNGI